VKTGMAKIKLIGYAAEILGYREKTIKIRKPTRLARLLKFPEKVETQRLIILINDAPATLDSIVTDKDEIRIIQMLGGG